MYMYTVNRFSQPLAFVCYMLFVVQMAAANFYHSLLLELAVFLYCIKKNLFILVLFSLGGKPVVRESAFKIVIFFHIGLHVK